MEERSPVPQPSAHRTDAYAQKFDEKAEAVKNKTEKYHHKKEKDDSQPSGGVDETPVPRAPPGYTVKFTFHRAHNLPFADINTLSSDPYIMATLATKLAPRHRQDPDMVWRTPTIRRNVDPVWESAWIVANVPASGFALKARIYDEDPADKDDRLGNVHIRVDSLREGWEGIHEQSYKIKKRMGSKRAYMMRGCAAMFNREIHMSGDLVVSVELLGRTETDNGGQLWTVGPCNYTKHFSNMIGRLAGTKEPGEGSKAKTESYSFQANQIQLKGPVPPALYHRYVEFKPFVKGMFTATSLRGRVLHHALIHQHKRIYNYSRDTVYGSFPAPCEEMTLKFLDLVHWDKGGRIFTYVLTLDGQWRFTETGKEFGIDMLSKHTMHSNVNVYIAFSGEFFIRRLKNPHKPGSPSDQDSHPPTELPEGPPAAEGPKDPAYYSLIIDNDSGTYRPSNKLLPQLREFFETNLVGMKVVTLDCQGDKDKMDKWKDEQREHKKAEGQNMAVVQGDGGSMSSSDLDDLDEQQQQMNGGAEAPQTTKDKMLGAVEAPLEKAKNVRKGERTREARETEEDQAGSSQP